MFEDLIPELQGFAEQLLYAAGAAGLHPRVTSTRRSHQAQVRLYRRYVSGLSPLPAAPPGQSAHEYGFAFDMVVTPFDALEDVGYTWEQWGGVWGGAVDPVHFQYPGFVAPTVAPISFPEVLGTAMGKSATDVFQPLSGSLPRVKEAIKLGTADPYAIASLSADMSMWVCRNFPGLC